eukprot:8424456-Pyramimonas_sp.AAC.1
MSCPSPGRGGTLGGAPGSGASSSLVCFSRLREASDLPGEAVELPRPAASWPPARRPRRPRSVSRRRPSCDAGHVGRRSRQAQAGA